MSSTNGHAPADRQQRLADGAACLAAALDYHALGWSVLPVCPPDHVGVGRAHQQSCDSPGKAPWGPWKQAQEPETRFTADDLEAKWRDNPCLNTGIATGPASGMVRVDVDGLEGERQLQEKSGGDLPKTLEFTSGRENGGRGLLYRIPEGVELRTTHESQAEKSELRLQAKGAQTVLPPSRHPSGSLYEWKAGHSPDDIDAALAPAWLIEALRADKTNGRQGKAQTLADGELIKAGNRDSTLTSLAGSMRRRGMGEAAIFSALKVENEERCDPPLEEEQVRKIAHSVAKYPPHVSNGQAKPSTNGQHKDEGVRLGCLLLVLGKPRQTPGGKLTAPVRLYQDGAAIDQIVLTSTPNGRKQAVKQLLEKAGEVEEEEARQVVERLVAEALTRLERREQQQYDVREGATLRNVLEKYTEEHFGPAHLTKKGVWFNKLGRDLDRPGFLQRVNNDIIAICGSAVDVDKGVERPVLITRIELEMRVLFGDLLKTLPQVRPENEPVHFSQREDLAAAIIAMWSRVVALTKTRINGDTETTHNTSLVEQVKTLLRQDRVPLETWHQIHPGHPAYCCRVDILDADGQVLGREPLLAMNASLANSSNVKFPEGITHFNLKRIGKTASLFREVESVSTHSRDGTKRVIVLSKALTDYLLTDLTSAGESVNAAESVKVAEEQSEPSQSDI